MFHHGPIAAVAAFGPYVATAGYDNQVILWNGERRQAVARSSHDHLVNHCAFSSDGALLVSASSDYSARVWEIPSLRLKACLTGHEDDVDMAVFSPDDRLIATCALDRKIRLFDLAGRCLKVLEGHTGNIISVAWEITGKRLVSSSVDGTVREWDAASGREIRCTELGVRSDTIAILQDGTVIAGDDKGRIAVISRGAVRYTQAHQAGIKKIVYDPAHGVVSTLSYDRTLAVWRVSADLEVQIVSRTPIPDLVWARSAAVIKATKVAVGTFGSSYGVFDWKDNSWDLSGIQPSRALNAVAVRGGSVYAIGDAGVLFRDGLPVSPVGSLCNFLVDAGDMMLTGGQLGRLFNAVTGEVLYQHHSPLNCGAAFQCGASRCVAIGTYTGDILVFALEKGGGAKLVFRLDVFPAAVKGLIASQDRLFSVCASTAIAWHDLADFSLIRKIDRAHERIANGCCLAGPDGFASIGRDRKLRIWSERGEEVYPTPHPNSVKCICASDDGSTLMTGAYTGTVAGFDYATRSWTSFARPTAAGISSLAYDPARRQFLAGSYDGHVHVISQEPSSC